MPTAVDRAAERQRRRRDPDEAERALVRLFPDEDQRRALVEILGESIDEANRTNRAAWELTLKLDTPILRLNVGQILVLSLQPENVLVALDKGLLDSATRKRLKGGGATSHRFNMLPELRYFDLSADTLTALWPELRASHVSALSKAGEGFRASPFYQAHSPGVLEYLGRALERDFPPPAHATAEGQRGAVEGLVELVRRIYPGWSGFDDQRFVAEELEYKRKVIDKAKQLISRGETERLLKNGADDELIQRLRTLATNLLYLGVPRAGDLNVLFQDDLDKPAFCKAFVELLYGGGDGADRLGKYTEWVASQGLPNKWTFPTYFLFLCWPDREMFIKPSTASSSIALLGSDLELGAPSAEAYAEFRALVSDLRKALAQYGPRDMVDVQSFLYVASRESGAGLIEPQKRAEVERLFEEFRTSYVLSDKGQRHKGLYAPARGEAEGSFESISQAAARGEDVTDQVLLRLLPYGDFAGNRERGAWTHWAPAVTKDLKQWFEGSGWAKPEDWPDVAEALLKFVQRLQAKPGELAGAWKEFQTACPARGLQSGLLTPILNALRPDDFLVFNKKSRRVINYLAGTKFHQSFDDFPKANATGLALVEELDGVLRGEGLEGLDPGDVFDMFTHWLVAVKKFDLGKRRYCKIAPEEGARLWALWREKGIVSVGWNSLGDLTGIGRKEFEARRDAAMVREPSRTKTALEQVWRFVRLEEGDRVVANNGTTKVLGFGTVTGEYEYVPDAEHAHQIPVEWDDLRPRTVDERGWRRTFVELKQAHFESLLSLPVDDEDPGRPPPDGAAFSRKSFELLGRLHESPTREFYLKNKTDFVNEIEGPFQKLFQEVVAKLPPTVTEHLETEKNVFSRIIKNDWGRGGAWPFYWGALYPKGGRRVEDAQLFVGVHRDHLEYGFYVGHYGGEKSERFGASTRQHENLLVHSLEGVSDQRVGFGSPEELHHRLAANEPLLGWKEWLANLPQQEIGARVNLPKEEVLATSSEQLAEGIAALFVSLLPMVLFASLEEPAPAVRAYLGLTEPESPPEVQPQYPLAQAARDTGLPEPQLGRWVRAIERKGQAVFYGPPGTGKTFVARGLARHLVGGGDGFVELVQFHPSYAYEDFIQGIRPRALPNGGLSYEMARGRFLEFCARAREREGRCVLIVDEINRANLSRVFGELMYLMEYRSEKVPLAGGSSLEIPKNVRLIGTMNTADRSIALVDHALRRRFAFLRLQPVYEVLTGFHAEKDTGFPAEKLVAVLKQVNQAIGDHHYEVGISFFLREDLRSQIEDVWLMEIEPYLEEYFFDQPEKVNEHRWTRVRERLGLGD